MSKPTTKPRAIPDSVIDRQIAASDPDRSAWVAANAGSGKTHVLAQRVIRLLLAGVDPARILCITFTKAAAANMANRVFGTLPAWTVLAAADITFRDMVREVIRNRDKLMRWVDAAGGVPQAMTQLSQALGVQVDETVQQIDDAIFRDSHIANSEWTAVGAALTGGSKTDKEQGARFHALVALTGTELLDTYLDIFCTSKREKTKDRIATGAVQNSHPDLCHRLHQERDRVWALVQHKRAIDARDRSVALFTIAHAVIARFRAEKDRRGLLDYEDLNDKTLDLLTTC